MREHRYLDILKTCLINLIIHTRNGYIDTEQQSNLIDMPFFKIKYIIRLSLELLFNFILIVL